MAASLKTRVRTFWQRQRAAFACLMGRRTRLDPSEQPTAAHYAAVFRRERDEALAEVRRLQQEIDSRVSRRLAMHQHAESGMICIPPISLQEVRWAFDNDLEAGSRFEWNVGSGLPHIRTRVSPRPTALYRDTEQEDL